MNEQIVAKILTDEGGKLWEKTTERDELRRVYFNSETIADAIGLDVSYYNTGNVSGATLDGGRISNFEARRILGGLTGKFFYDYADGKFHWTSSDYEGYVSGFAKILRQKLNDADTETVEIAARLDAITVEA